MFLILFGIVLFFIFFYVVRILFLEFYNYVCFVLVEVNCLYIISIFKRIYYVYYYWLYFELILEMIGVIFEDIWRIFWFYDFSLNVCKNRIDIVEELFFELNKLEYNVILLKFCECKVFYVVWVILKNNFGFVLFG